MEATIFLRQDKMRLEITSRIAETVMRLHMSGPVVQEISGKIWEKFGKNSGQDRTAQYHLGKVLNGLEMN